MMRLARETMAAGGGAPAVYNAANEVAVTAFLGGQIPFLAISRAVEQTLGSIDKIEPSDLSAVLTLDAEARRLAAVQVAALKSKP
jgi:1-deoxy-D-xylulose-5-phosphate reductoisomerase